MTATKKTYRLASSDMAYTPGIVRWAINGYRFEIDRPAIMNVMRSYPVPDAALQALLSREVPYSVDDRN